MSLWKGVAKPLAMVALGATALGSAIGNLFDDIGTSLGGVDTTINQ